MPLVLSQSKKEEIFRFLKKAFSDFRYFDEKMSQSIHQLIDKSTMYDFDSYFMNDLLEFCYGPHYQSQYLDSKEKKDIFQTIRIILHATVIYLFSLNPLVQDRLYKSTDDLLRAYPQFKEQLLPLERSDNNKELNNLLIFRNYMVIALLLLPAKENKIFLLRIIERLEGSNEQYITGTGQKPSTTRRCDIFHQESGTEMMKKRPRKPKDQSTVNTAKVPKTSNKLKKASTVPSTQHQSDVASILAAYSSLETPSRRGRKRAFIEVSDESESVTPLTEVVASNKAARATYESSPRSISNCGISPRPTPLPDNTNTWPQKSSSLMNENNLPPTVTHNKYFNKEDENCHDSYMELLPLPLKLLSSSSSSSSSEMMNLLIPSNNDQQDVLLFSMHPSPLQTALLKKVDYENKETLKQSSGNSSNFPSNVIIVNAPSSSSSSSSLVSTSSPSFPPLPPPQSIVAAENERMYHLLLYEPYQGSFTEDIQEVFF